MIIWGLVVALVIFFAFLTTRMASRETDESLRDMGNAILEFGRAFPNEAIRQLHATADGNAVFVRLHDNKAGFMRNLRGHFSCHLIEPGTVRVRPLDNSLGLAIEFLDAPGQNGSYTFAQPQEAAEVSLWLLGNYVSAGDLSALPSAVPRTKV